MSAALTAQAVYKSNVRKYWPMYLIGTTAVVVVDITEFMAPKFVQWAIDTLDKGTAALIPQFFKSATVLDTINKLMITFLIMLLIGWVGRIAWRQTLAKLSHIVGFDLRSMFWRQLRFQPLTTFQQYSLGDLMNRASGDWNSARFVHGFTLVGIIDLFVAFFTGIGLMLWIDPVLTLLCFIPILIVPRKLMRLSKAEYDSHLVAQNTLSDLSEEIAGTLRTIKLQRATGSSNAWREHLNTVAAKYAAQSFDVIKIGLRTFPLVATPIAMSYVIVIVFGIGKVQNQQLTIGELVALLSLIHLIQGPLWEMGFLIAEWQKGFASLDRMAEIYNMDISPQFSTSGDLNTDISKKPEAIRFENLSFKYPDDERLLIDNLTLAIPRGTVVGIKGGIGEGKSTLLNLCTGLQTGYGGKIRLFDEEINEVSRQWLTENITVVPQRAFLFSGTILQNLSLDGDFTEQQIWRALEIVQIKKEVEDLPNGIHAWIGEWGITLSGGQRQRLAIARALLRPQPILLLDDCLSAVDSVTEEGILANLRQEFANQTVVWVAHRSSTLRYCDLMYELKNGKLENITRGRE